ncbi:MAG: hypothetical protein ACREFB_07370, partial [Stellaceae bacterium]
MQSVVAADLPGGCVHIGLAQELADERHAFAALRLASERTVDHRHRAAFSGIVAAQIAIGDGIAQANVHACLGRVNALLCSNIANASQHHLCASLQCGAYGEREGGAPSVSQAGRALAMLPRQNNAIPARRHNMAETPTFGRYAEIPYDQMTPEQQDGYRSLMEARGRRPGPNKIYVHNPKLVKV